MYISDQINELRAELSACVFTKAEHARIEAELAALILKRDAADEADTLEFLEVAGEKSPRL